MAYDAGNDTWVDQYFAPSGSGGYKRLSDKNPTETRSSQLSLVRGLFGGDHTKEVVVEGKKPKLKYRGRIMHNQIREATTESRFVAFRGIPYAAPPVEERRFQPPAPLGLGIGSVMDHFRTPEYSAAEDQEPCLQRDENDQAFGSEDCLYLNVYMPKKPDEIAELLPVLVFFHGGSFKLGSGGYETITPDSIMKYDLIFVTVNYRTGPIGFLNMQTQSCRGNMGLKDQTHALKWIQDNIKKFKGNPEKVTISGHGSGASCVNFHLISPLSKGLFHQAIVSGGGIYCPWGFKGHQREWKELVKQASGEEEPVVEEREEDTLEYKARKVVTEYFLQKTAEDFVRAAEEIMDDYTEEAKPTELTVFIGPSVEIDGKHNFLPEQIETLMKKATPVPVLAGITKNEGNQIFIGQSTDALVQLVKDETRFFAYLELHFEFMTNNHTAMRKIRKLYFGEDPQNLTDRQIEQGLVDLHTDISHRRFYDNFLLGENEEDRELYVYEFDYFDDLNTVWQKKLFGELKGNRAAGHGDELLYLYCPNWMRKGLEKFKPEVEHVVQNMCSIWANFCVRGDPRSDYEPVQWRKHTSTNPCHMHIGEKLTLKEGSLNEERWKFWRDIVREEPEIKSLNIKPETPDAPTILAPQWKDPEEVNVVPKYGVGRPEGRRRSSVLIPLDSKRGSLGSEKRSSITTVTSYSSGTGISSLFGLLRIGRKSSQTSEEKSTSSPERSSSGTEPQPGPSSSSMEPQPGPSSLAQQVHVMRHATEGLDPYMTARRHPERGDTSQTDEQSIMDRSTVGLLAPRGSISWLRQTLRLGSSQPSHPPANV